MGLAGMEDARVKAGNGLVERGKVEQEATSVQDYFAGRRALRQGTAEHDALQEKRMRQSGLRKLLEGKVKALIQEDMRYR